MFKVGYRYPATATICKGRECEEAHPVLELGRIYEAEVTVSVSGFLSTPTLAERAYIAIRELRKKYPGVSINYIEVTEKEGNYRVVVQMFDPQLRAQAIPIGIIIVLSLILAILLVSYTIIDTVIRYMPEMPKTKYFWWAILGIAGTATAGYVISQIKR